MKKFIQIVNFNVLIFSTTKGQKFWPHVVKFKNKKNKKSIVMATRKVFWWPWLFLQFFYQTLAWESWVSRIAEVRLHQTPARFKKINILYSYSFFFFHFLLSSSSLFFFFFFFNSFSFFFPAQKVKYIKKLENFEIYKNLPKFSTIK